MSTSSPTSPRAGIPAFAGEERPGRILVVDDNVGTRYQVVRILKQEGFEIFEAGSGNEALRVASIHQPDLIVLDVKMPDMLGFEVTERLRADPITSHISIMHLSATFTDADAKARGLSGGADA